MDRDFTMNKYGEPKGKSGYPMLFAHKVLSFFMFVYGMQIRFFAVYFDLQVERNEVRRWD